MQRLSEKLALVVDELASVNAEFQTLSHNKALGPEDPGPHMSGPADALPSRARALLESNRARKPVSKPAKQNKFWMPMASEIVEVAA